MAYPEEIEETKSIIQLASPATLKNEMAPPNYKIGPVTPHTREKGPLQGVAEQAGASVLGKAGEAALFGTGAAGTGTASAGAGTAGMWPAFAKGATALGPWGWALAAGLGLAALKNKGGKISPLGAQYKEGGGKARLSEKEEELRRKYAPSLWDKTTSFFTGKPIDQQAIDSTIHTEMTDLYGTPYYRRFMNEEEMDAFSNLPSNKNIGAQYKNSAAYLPSGLIDMITMDADHMSWRRPRWDNMHKIWAGPLADDKYELKKLGLDPALDDQMDWRTLDKYMETARRMQHGQGFNKGGNVQYKEHGGSSYRKQFPGIGGFSMLRPFVKGVDSLTGYDRYPHSSDNSSAMYTGQSWNEMGPLSQEKTKPQSTKIEKKETIEYKN